MQRSKCLWQGRQGSNLRPSVLETGTLPAELLPYALLLKPTAYTIAYLLQFDYMQKLILASSSPRRKVLMQCMGLQFDVVPSGFTEWLDDSRSPEDMAIELGLGKAKEVAALYHDSFVIGGDLIIEINGTQLAKPESPAEAKTMLKLLSGATHYALGSLVLIHLQKQIEDIKIAKVKITFKNLPESVIDEYIATGDPYDKAGGYARQHPLIQSYIKVDGDAHALTGLSTIQLRELLTKHGIPVPNNEAKTRKLYTNSDPADQNIII